MRRHTKETAWIKKLIKEYYENLTVNRLKYQNQMGKYLEVDNLIKQIQE